MSTTPQTKEKAREKLRAIAAEFQERGDDLGWFDEVYRQAAGDIEEIPWADLEPNRFFREWAERSGLNGNGRKALVVGCGLGDDAKYLDELGFEVTAFDISPSAIEWAERLHKDTDIKFEVADLFQPYPGWVGAFDLVLEIYTIQPLPMETRGKAIEAIASFVAPGGRLIVICHGRDDNDEVGQIPYPLARADLSRFVDAGLTERSFQEVWEDDEGVPVRRFVVEYVRPEG